MIIFPNLEGKNLSMDNHSLKLSFKILIKFYTKNIMTIILLVMRFLNVRKIFKVNHYDYPKYYIFFFFRKFE